MTTTKTDLNKITFFKPVAGKTLREQLQGKKLAGQEVVEYLRSLRFADDFVFPPGHEQFARHRTNDARIFLFSLEYVAPRLGHETEQERLVHGVNWAPDGFHVHYRRFDTADPLDLVVGEGWEEGDWILIENE